MTAQLVEDLAAARALVAKGWTRRAFARNKRGTDISMFADEAVKFCVRGAIRRVADDDMRRTHQMARLLEIIALDGCLATWNDRRSRTQSDVVELFDHAIAVARSATP